MELDLLMLKKQSSNTSSMKTAVTVIRTVQVGMEEYRDLKTTKIFDDDSIIGEIKDWIIKEGKLKASRDKVGLSAIDISDVASE